MKFETGKKILKISGTLMIIGAVISILLAVLSLVMGGAGTQMPDVETNEEFAKGVVALLGTGVAGLISGLYSLVEGIVSRAAAKDGKHVKAAEIFATVGVINAVFSAYADFKKSGLNTTTIVSAAVLLCLTLLVLFAAKAVRKGTEEA